MVDVFWTIIVVWVIFRIYSGLTSFTSEKKTYFYQTNQQTHQHYYNNPKEGEVKVAQQQENQRKPNSDKGGEYIDFEEVKS